MASRHSKHSFPFNPVLVAASSAVALVVVMVVIAISLLGGNASQPEDDGPVEIKKMAMPMLSAAQLAEKAKRAGDTPDIVRDSVTRVTLFDYSDIIGADEQDVEED